MAGRDLFASSGGGSFPSGARDLFAPAGRTKKPKKKGGGHGFLHAVGSAVRNTGKAIEGIGPGLYETGKAIGEDIYHNPDLAYGPLAPGLIITESILRHHNPAPRTYKKIVKPTGKAYAHKYGPLAHGNLGEFAHRAFVEDPLGTVLDASTVATLGAGAAARTGLMAAAPRSVVLRAGESGAIERGIHGTQLSRTLRVQANKIAQRYPHLRVIGEAAQYGRALKARERRVTAGRQLKAMPHSKAMAKLSREERIASEIRMEYPTTRLFEEHKAQLKTLADGGDQIAGKQLKLLSNKKVNRYHTAPTPKMEVAEAEARNLGDISAGLSGLDEEAALRRRYQPALMLRGATKDEAGLVAPEGTTIPQMIDQIRSELQAEGRSVDVVHVTTPEAARAIRKSGYDLSRHGTGLGGADYGPGVYVADYQSDGAMYWRQQLETKNEKGIVPVTSLKGKAHLRKPFTYEPSRTGYDAFGKTKYIHTSPREALAKERSDLVPAFDAHVAAGMAENRALGQTLRDAGYDGLVLEHGQTQEIVAFHPDRVQFEGSRRRGAAPRPAPEPIYRPHESVPTKRGTHVGAGGTSPAPQKPGAMRQNRGVLAAMGRVAHNVDTLTPSYMRVVRFATYKDRFSDLLEAGQKIPKGEPLPEGYQYLRRSAAERIPFTEATAGDFERALDEMLGPEGGKIRDLLGTSVEDAAHVTEDGYRVIVPTSLVKKVTGEFERSNNVIAKFFANTTQVWRALVLNLRVGWLVNNLIGNTLMYTVKTAGAGGLRAYLGAMSDLHGPEWVVKHLVDDKQIISHLTPEDMASILPDQVAGTFFGTQYPGGGNRISRAATAPLRVLRHADIAYEQGLRRALANQLLRRSPEVRMRLKAMPKEERNFRSAAKEELAANPTLADRVSREINDALGQYDNMTPLEQRYIRAAVPFYGWFRAISIVMAKMPLDNPVRTNILYSIGRLGEQYDADGYPYGGAIPLGGGKILKTAGLNPYATLPQLAPNLSTVARAEIGRVPGTSLKSPEAGDVGYALSGLVNPLFSAPLGGGFTGIGANLPETQLVFPRKPRHPEKSLYDDYGRKAALLQYLGAPVRHLRKP